MRQIDVIKIYNTKRCLIVDDFTEVRGSLKRMLKTFGATQVDTAATSTQAMAQCQARSYDIVLCDYNLGHGKDGQQVLEELRHLRALMNTSLFVMITAESSRQMVLGALECQPDDYITKPITQASLRLRLDRALVKHQALYEIKQAIDNRDYRGGLALCDKLMGEQQRYAGDCLRIKAQLHYLLGEYPQAEKIYRHALALKPYIWARLGLGKTLLAGGELDEAEALLQSVIDEDSRYVEAHDLLAELYAARKDTLAAQASTALATQISPKSVTRHRRLAELAERNHDDEACITSYRNAIKWGMDSCHESPQDTFNYARKVAEVVNGDNSGAAKDRAREAMKSLERAVKRFPQDESVAMQAKFVESQIHASQGRLKEAQGAAEQGRDLYMGLEQPAGEASLDYARALLATEQHASADKLLLQLARENAGDKKVIEKIDGLASEPLTEAGKKQTADLTRQGIALYDRKQFKQAIDVFSEAVTFYPKHIGLNLNLVQVIIAEAKEKNNLRDYAKLYRRCLRQVQGIDQQHSQYQRYQYLQQQVAALEAGTGENSRQ